MSQPEGQEDASKMRSTIYYWDAANNNGAENIYIWTFNEYKVETYHDQGTNALHIDVTKDGVREPGCPLIITENITPDITFEDIRRRTGDVIASIYG